MFAPVAAARMDRTTASSSSGLLSMSVRNITRRSFICEDVASFLAFPGFFLDLAFARWIAASSPAARLVPPLVCTFLRSFSNKASIFLGVYLEGRKEERGKKAGRQAGRKEGRTEEKKNGRKEGRKKRGKVNE